MARECKVKHREGSMAQRTCPDCSKGGSAGAQGSPTNVAVSARPQSSFEKERSARIPQLTDKIIDDMIKNRRGRWEFGRKDDQHLARLKEIIDSTPRRDMEQTLRDEKFCRDARQANIIRNLVGHANNIDEIDARLQQELDAKAEARREGR